MDHKLNTKENKHKKKITELVKKHEIINWTCGGDGEHQLVFRTPSRLGPNRRSSPTPPIKLLSNEPILPALKAPGREGRRKSKERERRQRWMAGAGKVSSMPPVIHVPESVAYEGRILRDTERKGEGTRRLATVRKRARELEFCYGRLEAGRKRKKLIIMLLNTTSRIRENKIIMETEDEKEKAWNLDTGDLRQKET